MKNASARSQAGRAPSEMANSPAAEDENAAAASAASAAAAAKGEEEEKGANAAAAKKAEEESSDAKSQLCSDFSVKGLVLKSQTLVLKGLVLEKSALQ